MNCKHTKRAMKSLICGEKADIRSIREHLTVCPRCNRRYDPFLAVLHSIETPFAPPLDEDAWREFSAKLHTRITQERPASFGRWRSLLLWTGQWKVMRLRRALAVSVLAIAFVASLAGFLPKLWHGQGRPDEVAYEPPESAAPLFIELPPTAADAMSILGDGGFITGVFFGDIQPGDFFEGHELDPDDIVEALDYLFS